MVRGERFTLVLSNQNLEWHKEYDRKEYLKVDPYFAHASSRFGPYAWRDIQPTSAAAKAFLARMKEVGLEHGVGSSYITHTGDTGLLTFAGPKEPPGFWSDEGMSVHLMCGAFTRAVVHLHDRPTAGLAEDAALTPQERLCLELSAVGLTAKKIGALHSMSERTVRYHLDCAAEKLKVRTRREAVAEALLRGLIIKLHPTMPKLSDR